MTGCERILRVLADGQPHSHKQLYAETYTVVHSRVTDLRKRGHVIECWRDGDTSWYQLCAPSSPGAHQGGRGTAYEGVRTLTANASPAPSPSTLSKPRAAVDRRTRERPVRSDAPVAFESADVFVERDAGTPASAREKTVTAAFTSEQEAAGVALSEQLALPEVIPGQLSLGVAA